MTDARVIERRIGQRIRLRRKLMGISVTDLATAAEVSTRQLHRHERGEGYISALRLQHFGDHLGVPFSYFFMSEGSQAVATTVQVSANDEPSPGVDRRSQ